MEIKDLNKPQLIMLALLLSFVTSIATGITTVTLLQQAPASVVTPINNVVRETVEKIVPVPGKNTVQTVVIKEEDLVVDAIAKNQDAIFRLVKDTADAEGKTSETFVARGFAVSKEGVIVSDASLVEEGNVYFLKNDNGKFKAEMVNLDKEGFVLFKIGEAVDQESKLTFSVPTFGDISAMKAGQKILILGETINSFIYDGDRDLRLEVPKSKAGAIVLNMDGEVLGLALSKDVSFAPINVILESLNTANSKTEPVTDVVE